MKTYRFSEKSKDRMDGVHSKLVAVAHRALELCPIDFGIPPDGGVRTARRQKELYNTGASQKDGVIRHSKHQFGRALDFACVGNRPEDLAVIAACFLKAAGDMGIKIWWGGMWPNFKDFPHIQLEEDEL